MTDRRAFVRTVAAAAAGTLLPRSARAPAASPQGGVLAHRFPPASVTRLTLALQ